jgi:hypothetical protein
MVDEQVVRERCSSKKYFVTCWQQVTTEKKQTQNKTKQQVNQSKT